MDLYEIVIFLRIIYLKIINFRAIIKGTIHLILLTQFLENFHLTVIQKLYIKRLHCFPLQQKLTCDLKQSIKLHLIAFPLFITQ